MRMLLVLPVLLICSLIVNPAWSANFQKGLVAYNKGDYKTAVQEWGPLAEQGNVNAQKTLGLMFYSGHGVPREYKTAFKWHTRSAEQGDAIAQNNLAVMYYYGYGIQQDFNLAYMWLNIAESLGNKTASATKLFVARKMSLADVSRAQQLTSECIEKSYIGCGG